MLKHAKLMNPQHSNIPHIHHHHLNIILIQFHFMNSSLAASYILMATSSSTSVISFTHATQKITTTWNCGERTQGLGSSKPGKGILYQQLLHKVLSTGTDCRPWLLSKVRLFLQYLVVITKNQTQNKWALSIPQLNTSVWRGNTVWITCFFLLFLLPR